MKSSDDSCDRFDAWTINSMKTEKYHGQNLGTPAGLRRHLRNVFGAVLLRSMADDARLNIRVDVTVWSGLGRENGEEDKRRSRGVEGGRFLLFDDLGGRGPIFLGAYVSSAVLLGYVRKTVTPQQR